MEAPKAEARLRDAIEGSFDAFVVYETVRDDAGAIVDFRIVDVNASATSMMHLPREQLRGKLLTELASSDRAEALIGHCARVVETAKAMEMELREPFPGMAEAWISRQVVPVEGGVAVTTRDITQRKSAEVVLRARDEKFLKAGSWSPLRTRWSSSGPMGVSSSRTPRPSVSSDTRATSS